MDYIVETSHPTRIYRDFTAASDASLHIRPGSIYGLLGPNRAGRLTTMKMLLGLTKPTSGSFKTTGKCFPTDRIGISRSIGPFAESPSFYTNLIGWEDLKIIRCILDLPCSSVDEALELVGLHEFDGRLVRKYSPDTKQRLGLAGAMLGRPPILFLGKPTNGLDLAGIHEVRSLVTSLPSRYDRTVLVISHLLAEVGLVARDIGVLSRERMLSEGNLEALRELAVHEGLVESSLEDTFLVVIRNDNATRRERALL